MKKISLIFLTLLFVGCSINKQSKTNFIKFVNDGSRYISSDNDIIKDKMFTIQIPNSLSMKKVKISYYFLNDLKFNNNQRIITIYDNDKIFKFKNSSIDYSYNEFIGYLKELDIEYELRENKFIKNRRFGLKVLDNNFIIMYVNIKKENIKDYEYSINSLSFDKN